MNSYSLRHPSIVRRIHRWILILGLVSAIILPILCIDMVHQEEPPEMDPPKGFDKEPSLYELTSRFVIAAERIATECIRYNRLEFLDEDRE